MDLYGKTRHSTTTYLSRYYSREEIKEHGTGHETSKAFDRYMQAEASKSKHIYQKASSQDKASEQRQDNIIIEVDFSKKSGSN